MGVDITNYVVYGIKREYTEDLSDVVEECYENNIDMVADGMCGDYVVFGPILSQIEENSNDNFKTVDINDLEEKREQYMKDFTKLFPDHAHILDGEWKILSFAHYW